MKTCAHCNTPAEDTAVFCSNCGTPFANENQSAVYTTATQQTYYQPPTPPTYAPVYDPYDHTAEFDAKDISDNKVFAMLVYLMGVVGILIALLASKDSPYTLFHIRQALKFTVVEILATLCMALLLWTIIVPIVYAVLIAALCIIKIICFVDICSGKAKEPTIIRNLDFLK